MVDRIIVQRGTVMLVERQMDKKPRFIVCSPSKISDKLYSERQQLRDSLDEAKAIFVEEANKWKGFKYPKEEDENG